MLILPNKVDEFNVLHALSSQSILELQNVGAILRNKVFHRGQTMCCFEPGGALPTLVLVLAIVG